MCWSAGALGFACMRGYSKTVVACFNGLTCLCCAWPRPPAQASERNSVMAAGLCAALCSVLNSTVARGLRCAVFPVHCAYPHLVLPGVPCRRLPPGGSRGADC